MGSGENGYQNDMYSDLIDAMEAGDRIVIKSYFNQKDRPGLPFDGGGQNVTGMVIKVTGVISEHLPRMDGRRRVKVDWTRVIPGRDWYFSTSLHTVWKSYAGRVESGRPDRVRLRQARAGHRSVQERSTISGPVR